MDGRIEPKYAIIRPTQTYSKILQNSFHPQVIIEKQDFRSYLQKNIKKSSFLKDVSDDILNVEIAQLMNLTIPIFYSPIGSRDLLSSDNFKVDNFFKYSTIESVEKNITNINEQEENLQKFIIDSSFKTHVNFMPDQTRTKLNYSLLN